MLERGVAGFFVKASGFAIQHGLTRPTADVSDSDWLASSLACVLCWVWVLVAFGVLVGACRFGSVLCSGIVFCNTNPVETRSHV
jgi:hypothetical protein